LATTVLSDRRNQWFGDLITLHRHTRRGGHRRPVSHVPPHHPRAAGLWIAAAFLWLSTGGVAAHGGVPTLQLGSERINPGATIELLGDMTTEGAVELRLVSGTTVRSLGNAVADHEGHFQVFVIVPLDIPTGSYTVLAESDIERTSAPLVVAGLPIGGEEGQLPGQDEARAGVLPVASGAAVEGGNGATSSMEDADAAPVNVWIALVVLVAAVIAALVFGTALRARSSRAETE
jgi:hypothetical protein